MKSKTTKSMVNCAECGELIQVQYTDKSYELIKDQGVCKHCDYLFCADCLTTPVGMMRNSWSVSFRGYSCIKCSKEGPPVKEEYPDE